MKSHRISFNNQDIYISTQKKNQKKIVLYRFFLFIIFLLVWEYSANAGIIDAFFFSSPSRVILLFIELCSTHMLFRHIAITLLETLISFGLVFIISLLVSTSLWYCDNLSRVLEPYLVILNSLPKSALAPLFIVWLGTGMKTIVIAGISVALFGSIISFYTGFCQSDPEKVTLIYTLGGHKTDVFRKVIFPGSLPTLLSTSKVNIGLSLVGVIIGEFLAARYGLGYLIIYGSQVFALNLVITSIIILCIIAFGFYMAIQKLENFLKNKMGL